MYQTIGKGRRRSRRLKDNIKKGFTGRYTDPKVYDELQKITGLDRSTIQTYKSVSDNVESLLRNKDLSFNHHKEVAKLPPEQQKIFLIKIQQKTMSKTTFWGVIPGCS
jgi:hypothetical protein